MSSVSKTILIGRVGKDPEVKTVDSGNQVATFSLATSETWKDRTTGEKKESTDWHNIVIWGKLAGIVEKYVKKGDLLYLEGKNKTRSWEKDGVTRYVTEVVCHQMQMLGTKTTQRGADNAPESTQYSTDHIEEDEDGLPF